VSGVKLDLNCLFWNTGGHCPDQAITELAATTQANLVALVEYPGDGHSLMSAFTAGNNPFFMVPVIGCDRVKLFTSFSLNRVTHRGEADRYTIKEVGLPGALPLLACVVHLRSKLHASAVDQLHAATYFRFDLEKAEDDAGHRNTVVFGDFNMNPFDPGMVSAIAINSIPCLVTARRGSRTIDKRDHAFFYNPTWNLLGDFSGPPGTYFHSSPGSESHYWNTLDQVLVRPGVADRFRRDAFAILTTTGTRSRVNHAGRPHLSDHLPIAFTIDLS
jgi:hypothetical protein